MKKPLENRRGWRWLLLLALCVGIAGVPHPVVQNVAETSIQGLQYQPSTARRRDAGPAYDPDGL